MGGSDLIVPVIMCGGAGTRLWPASRESMPKQFIPLLGGEGQGEDAGSTFQAAVRRIAPRGDGAPPVFAPPVVVTHHEARFIVAEQLAQVGVKAEILLEPQRRDSAAAVAVAALQAARSRGPGAVVLVMAADHVIEEGSAFVDACRRAAEAARSGGFVMTLGVVPEHPATAYGYVKPGAPIGEGRGGDGEPRRIERFVEKPDRATAATYIADGYLWNSGNFLFRADVMIRELERHAPATLTAARAALEGARVDLDFVRLDEEAFARAPKISIDYAVMERTERAGVLPVAFAWSDIGTWGALWDASARDARGNAVRGNVELVDAEDSLVHSDDILTTVVGLKDVIVVAKPDAVLVTSRERSGEVKDLVEALRAKKRREADEHLRMYRPWGWYQRIDLGPRFQVKRILVRPGGRLSLQKHFHRAEHWVVVHGTAEVLVGNEIQVVHENEAVYIPIGYAHRLTNPGRIPLEIIEVQVGSYTGEDDIVRMEDVYGR